MRISNVTDRAGQWFLESGIQESCGGVSRYYRADLARNNPISTEITGYAVSVLVYLYGLTGRAEYLDRASSAARFLVRTAWDREHQAFPFECDGTHPLTYFFDCGIIVRGLLALWRITSESELLECAAECGRAMTRDFAANELEYHPILRLPDKVPVERDDRWSRAPGCYQLKAAMAWFELFEATGERSFQTTYRRQLEYSLSSQAAFLPGHSDRERVMDRLHAYCYFLEGMLPIAGEDASAAAIRQGIERVAGYLREIGTSFERSDVYAQLLRMRIFAAWTGTAELDTGAASTEASHLAGFQLDAPDPRLNGGFSFGRRCGELIPHVNPVSAAFAVQALELWDRYLAGSGEAAWHGLI